MIQKASDLIRIFFLSVILSVAYAINFASIIQAIISGERSVWSITYAISVLWLCLSCLLIIIITSCGVMIKVLSTHNYAILLSLITGAFINLISIILAVWFAPVNQYVHWELESLYTLLPLYLACLIYFFEDLRFTHIINLSIFCIILFITPFIRLLITLEWFQFPLSSSQPMPYILLSTYLSICFGTALLTSIHILFLYNHYNSGLFLKTSIISSLIYNIYSGIKTSNDYALYIDTYRMYYYFVFLFCIYIIYVWQIFLKGNKKVVEVDMTHIRSSPSFDINIETMDADSAFEIAANKPTVKSLLHLVSNSSADRASTISPPLSPSISPASPISPSSKYNGFNNKGVKVNPNESILSIIKAFPDFKPCEKNKNQYFDEIIINSQSVIDIKHKRIDRVTDSICAIVPFYNEDASELHATLRSLYFNFEYIKKKDSKYKFTHFNVLLVGDGWFKADITAKRYLAKLYSGCNKFKHGVNMEDYTQQKHKHNTIILQTKHNRKLCINPFRNAEKKLFLKVTTIIKIDNRKKANSHEWFLGRYGFAEWCKCDYMFFTDAYSTLNEEGLYMMLAHMKEPKNSDVVCCTGRARVYTIEQELDLRNLLRETHSDPDEKNDDDDEIQIHLANNKSIPYIDADVESISKFVMAGMDEDDDKYDDNNEWWENSIFKKDDELNVRLFDESGEISGDNRHNGENIFYKIQDMEYDHRLTINAHLRSCQMFEFEALYGTIGCYLLGGFLPVIPGPCGFYRSEYLLEDEVRGWYFEKINQTNDPSNIDLVLGNMKLAEDRILTISSILNASKPVRHSLIVEAIFYFDPMPNITQLMKQRRRWLNGSIATVIFVLRKISFSRWKVNIFRRLYVLSIWYMQLLMYIVICMSPPLIWIISFEYGLATILDVILIDHRDGQKDVTIKRTTTILLFIAWTMFLLYLYYMSKDNNNKRKNKRQNPNELQINNRNLKIILKKFNFFTIRKETMVQLTLFLSYSFGILTLIGTLMQMIHVMRPDKKLINSNDDIVTSSFNFAVIIIEVTFFVQSFVLAPIVSKDFKTLKILVSTCFHYFIYAPFYTTYFFINALANLHDLSWGTRPDNELNDDDKDNGNNPKETTYKVLFFVVLLDIVVALIIQPFTEYIYAHVVFFVFLAFPSLYQIAFTLVWLLHSRFIDLWKACKPKAMKEEIQYTSTL